MVLKFKAKFANTGAATFAPNGVAAAPILGGAHSALQGGEIIANGDIWLQWNSSLNGGIGAWVLLDSTGGNIQAPDASQSGHAVNLGPFAASLAANGYVKVPVIVAGVKRTLIVQWIVSQLTASTTSTVTLPIPWPNAGLVAVPGSMTTGLVAANTPAFAAQFSGLAQVSLQNTYNSSNVNIGVIMIGW